MAIGSGVLSLPYVLAICGWVLGTIFILVGGLAGYLSLYMIATTTINTNSKNFSELA